MEPKRINVSSGAPWEEIVGYSRAVRVGNVIEVAGTVAADAEGNVIGTGDAATQTRAILDKIEQALNTAGASLTNVVRTRIFVTDISQWEHIGRVHGEYFKDIRPATTMVEVRNLIQKELLVEIEATAIL